MSRARRRAAERRGRVAETFAALWLALKGYRLLAHRARTPFGELDLVALKRGVLVIVEVKQRADVRAGLEAVGWGQRRRIADGAAYWAGRAGFAGLPMRFDLVVVSPGAWPVHVRGAWRLGD